MLEIKQLTKKYKKRNILNSINLNITSGEIIGLVGENGCGKSTLLKTLSLLTSFDSGDIYFNDLNVKKNRKVYLNNLGVFIENPCLYEELSGYENLKIMSRLYQNKVDIDFVIDIFNCISFIHEKTKTYSLGMKQKLGLMIAFINKPSLVLLDEPFNALDTNSEEMLISFINQYRLQKNSFIIVSHSIEKIKNICNRILTIDKGTLIDYKVNKGDFND